MILFAHLGYIVVGFSCVLVWWVGRRALSTWLAAILVFITCIVVSLTWADGIAHVGKQLIIGPCNPYYAACNGEHEGWTGITTSASKSEKQLFRLIMCGPPPGGSISPLLPWWGNPPLGTWCK
jgi:hypothetical protein